MAGSAATTRCFPAGAYVGATLLITAALSTGPMPVPSRITILESVGASSATKYTQPAAFESTGGRPSSALAAGPSVATTTADAEISPPSTIATEFGVVDATVAPSRTVPAGSREASWFGISCIPPAGTAASPSASIRKITSNIRRLSPRSGSSWIPPTSGRKNRWMTVSEKPAPRSAIRVVTSSPPSSWAGSMRRSCARSLAMRSLSPTEPIGDSSVDTVVVGKRNGSDTAEALPCLQTSAPGSNRCSSSASRSNWRTNSGYAVSATWNPRSTRNSSIRSVRTRPPTPSLASNTTMSTPAPCKATAHDNPASPAPTITTGASAITRPPCPSLRVSEDHDVVVVPASYGVVPAAACNEGKAPRAIAIPDLVRW